MIGFGQDNIILKSGDEILSKVIEIDKERVKYKKYSEYDLKEVFNDTFPLWMLKELSIE